MNQSQTVKEYMKKYIQESTLALEVTITPRYDAKYPEEAILTIRKAGAFTSKNLTSINFYLGVCMTSIDNDNWRIMPNGENWIFEATIRTTMKDGFNTVR